MPMNPFIDAAPAFALRMFAVDCTERHLWRDRMAGEEPSQECWDALKTMRTILADGPNEEAQAALGQKLFIQMQEHHRNGRSQRRAAWAMTLADPKKAARLASQSLVSFGPTNEQSWALARLTWLIATYQWAGDRMGFLIAKGEIETPEPMQIRA